MKTGSSIISVFVTAALVLFISSCSAPVEKEEKPKEEKPRVEKKEVPPEPRNFSFEQRYFIRNAAIGKSTDIENPFEALRVIQIKKGTDEVLVINKIKTVTVNGSKEATETWFGIELPKFEAGKTYDVEKAVRVQYYQFNLGAPRVRYDGQSYRGTITVDGFEDDYILGSVDVEVTGTTTSFSKPPGTFKHRIAGAFRIQIVPLDALKMK
ncbi:MAG: hypothetical protein GXO82_01410 [Chlorobi bacterium]|nr:hypothetical protein [Chlorobiota bacterium]